jgi:hypothetical protein
MMNNTDVAFRIAESLVRERHAEASRERMLRASFAGSARKPRTSVRLSFRWPLAERFTWIGFGRTETA